MEKLHDTVKKIEFLLWYSAFKHRATL